jgi:type II secretory pathway component GspD/PulD (secretin)
MGRQEDIMLKKEPRKKGFGGACRLLVLAAILAAASSSHAAVEVIALRYRSPSEVLPLVKPLLSSEGKISADDRTSQLIIVDSEEAIERIRQTLAVFDRPAPQATIRVRFQETAERGDRSIAGGGRVSGDNWSVSAGQSRRSGDGLEVRVQDQSIQRSGDSEFFITAISGSWAYIRVGQDVPYSAYWVDLCRRHGRTAGYRRIETGFDVKPVVRETLAEVEIVPRISEMGAQGGGDVVRFAEAATRTVVPLGQWVIIGGSDQSGSEVVRAILEAGRRKQASALSIRLMVEGR